MRRPYIISAGEFKIARFSFCYNVEHSLPDGRAITAANMPPYGFLSKSLRNCGRRRQLYRRETLDCFASDQKQKGRCVRMTTKSTFSAPGARELRARNWHCQNLSKVAISAPTSRHPVDARNNCVLVPMYRRIPPVLDARRHSCAMQGHGRRESRTERAHTPARAASSYRRHSCLIASLLSQAGPRGNRFSCEAHHFRPGIKTSSRS